MGHIRFNESDGSFTLLCQPGFLAKNQLPSVLPEPINVPSLSASCGPSDSDRSLCPVRELRGIGVGKEVISPSYRS